MFIFSHYYLPNWSSAVSVPPNSADNLEFINWTFYFTSLLNFTVSLVDLFIYLPYPKFFEVALFSPSLVFQTRLCLWLYSLWLLSLSLPKYLCVTCPSPLIIAKNTLKFTTECFCRCTTGCYADSARQYGFTNGATCDRTPTWQSMPGQLLGDKTRRFITRGQVSTAVAGWNQFDEPCCPSRLVLISGILGKYHMHIGNN